MSVTLTTHVKANLDSLLGPGGADSVKALINSSHTALDAATRSRLEGAMGGIGEAKAFTDGCAANTAAATMRLKTAIMNRLEHHLHGRGHAEELILAIADGTVT